MSARLTRTVAAKLRRAGLERPTAGVRSGLDRLLPTSVYSAGPMRLAAKTVGHREYVREIQAGRDSYIFELIKRSLAPGDEAADIGAYIGAMTVAAAQQVGPTGRIHAFEPDPETFRALRRSVRASGVMDWVTARNLALARDSGRARLYRWNRDESQNSLLPNSEARPLEVEVASFDSVLTGRNVRLVKIDVEGTELAVLAGMTRWLQHAPEGATLILESNPSGLDAAGTSVDELIECIRSNEFTPFVIDERRRALTYPSLEVLRARVLNLYCTRGGSGSLR